MEAGEHRVQALNNGSEKESVGPGGDSRRPPWPNCAGRWRSLLGVDAPNSVPEADEVDLFERFNLELGVLHQLPQVQVGPKTELREDRRNQLFAEADEWIFTFEMVAEDQVTSGTADPLHFFDDSDRIGHGGNEVSSG